MKILQTAILLIFTLLVVPVFTYLFGIPLGDREWGALWVLIKICGASVAYCFLVGELTNNNSQVDKYWSILNSTLVAGNYIMRHLPTYFTCYMSIYR